jgi:multicomponent K+:H+ antiporter subunit G
MSAVPTWVEIVVAVLLVVAGLLSVVAAVGLVRLRSFFQRMHPPALANTCGTWAVALASALFFSALDGEATLQAWPIAILLSITAPVTTVLLARTALFRARQHREDVPPPMPGAAP